MSSQNTRFLFVFLLFDVSERCALHVNFKDLPVFFLLSLYITQITWSLIMDLPLQ